MATNGYLSPPYSDDSTDGSRPPTPPEETSPLNNALLSFVVMVPEGSTLSVHPSGNGYVINTGVSYITIQGHTLPTYNPETGAFDTAPVMFCTALPLYVGTLVPAPNNMEFPQHPQQEEGPEETEEYEPEQPSAEQFAGEQPAEEQPSSEQPAEEQSAEEPQVGVGPAPMLALPFMSFRCPVTGQWFLMYNQTQLPPDFSVDQDSGPVITSYYSMHENN